MRKVSSLAVACIVALTVSVSAQEKVATPRKISNEEAVRIAIGLRNLDGHLVVIKQNGADSSVVVPWEFGSASLRLRIANNLAIVSAVEKGITEARSVTFKEIAGRTGATELKVGTKDREDYERQDRELLAAPANGTQDLARIKVSELKLDKNEIAGTVIEALAPILDQDVK